MNASSINEAQRGVGGAVPSPKFITGEFPQISFFLILRVHSHYIFLLLSASQPDPTTICQGNFVSRRTDCLNRAHSGHDKRR